MACQEAARSFWVELFPGSGVGAARLPPGRNSTRFLTALFLWKSKSSVNMVFHFADVKHLKVISFTFLLLS